MGLQEISTQDEPLSSERVSETPAEDSGGLIAGLSDDGNKLDAVRGIMIGTVVGIMIWAVIFLVAMGAALVG
jgi:hypothetical protein